MKKLFFVTLVALALTACSFEMPELNIPTPDESQDITADNGDFTAAIGKTYTWTEAQIFPIFDSSQTAEDEKKLSIRKTEDGMLELVSLESKTVYGTLTDIKDGKATVAGVEIAINEDASILTVGGFTYNG